MIKKRFFRNLWYHLSANQRHIVRKFYFYPTDVLDSWRGKRHKYVPPKGYIYTGSPANSIDYITQSYHQLNLLKTEINLQPDDSVLDIGSGIGRTAISMCEYLSIDGLYEGFDVVKSGVDWCNNKIGKDYSNFNFTYIPLFNDLYNNSHLKAENFKFPYEEIFFDKIYSFSVFTHMQIYEIQNYLKEICKVLKCDGLAFSTFFLYDNDSELYISNKKGFCFPILKDGYRLMNRQVKSGNIAIHKDKLAEMMASENLIIEKIIDGFWKGKNGAKEYQDIVVFRRKS